MNCQDIKILFIGSLKTKALTNFKSTQQTIFWIRAY